MIAISTLLPLASLALKLGSKLLGDGTPQAKAETPVQEERLAPTVQSLSQRLGIQEADSEQNRPAINHFMGALMQTLGQESSGQPLPRLDALQSELDTLKGSLGNSDLNLDQLLYAFKQTLPNGKGEGVGKLLNASA